MRAALLALWFGGLTVYGVGLARAESLGFVAGALACPAGVEAQDCSAANATDVAQAPVRHETECGMVGQVLATSLSLAPGQRHKITCARRKG